MSFAFTPDDLQLLGQEQKVAIMESLLVAVMADGGTPRAETDRFDQEVETIPWGLERAELLAELGAARRRIQSLPDRQAGVALIERAARLIDSPTLREKVFRAMAAIVRADREMNRREVELLHGYAVVFAIPIDRIELIKAEVDAGQR